MKVIDITFIIIGVMVLILNYVSAGSDTTVGKLAEHFSTSSSTSNSTTLIKLDEEDINNKIPLPCEMYFTTFDKNSYSTQMEKEWKSLTNYRNTASNPIVTPILKFTTTPSNFARNGINISSLGPINGPLCNNLGISFNGTYTIMIVCKHGTFPTELTNDISILQLFISSQTMTPSTNNGFHLFIKKNGITNNNNVQLGKLKFQYVNEATERVCSTNINDETINIQVNILTFYFINVNSGTITIQTMSEINSTPKELLSIISTQGSPPSDTTFTNTALSINKHGNWNGTLYNFAIFSGNLTAATENGTGNGIIKIYNHVMNEYKKRNDSSYLTLAENYNNEITKSVEMKSCPFSFGTCQSCLSVDKWYDANSIVKSSSECKSAINTYCSANPTIPWCKCWDNTKATYDTESCQSFRSLFAGKSAIIDKLTQSDLVTIKNQYNLLTKDDCKLATDTAVNNVWQDTRKIVQPASTRISIPSDPEYNSSVVNYYTEGTDKNGGLTPQLLTATPVTDRISTSFDPTDSQAYQEYLKMQKKNGASDKSEALQNESYFNKFLQVIMPA
jgi:hypothetical protein